MESQTLYKRNSKGGIEEWSISVARKPNTSVMHITYGDKDGKKIVMSTPYISGKNIGKANETTPYQQAVLEANAKYQKQLKKGYVPSLEEAQVGKTDKRIEGAIAPMLAVKYKDVKHKIQFPMFIQAKLNGHRCVAIKRDGIVKLWSRARRPITTMPHVLEEVSIMLADQPEGAFLDGELYHHGWTLQRITSAIKKPNEDTIGISFCVYDCGLDDSYSTLTFEQRLSHLVSLDYHYGFRHYVAIVATGLVHSHEELMMYHDKFVLDGFEGAILRSAKGTYEYDHRSSSLIKVKMFEDSEFLILGVTAGNNKSVVFTVHDSSRNTESDVTMSGDKEDNQKYLANESLWKGKFLTVRFKEYTPDGKLFHATGLNIREDL